MALRRRRRAAAPAPMVFRWDLDKTYLKSEFESLRELVRIPFEKPEDKVAVPGVVPLIRGLHDVAAQCGREIRVFFMSASPPQIGKSIKAKLALDGITYDGIVFKNQLQHLVRGRFHNLREHVGFKLTELLKSRREMPAGARELLFGDDWESDPLIYSLYADLLAQRVAAEDLDDILRPIGVDPRLVAEAKALAAALEPVDAVDRIYINMERRTPPTNFRTFGARLVPTFNYLQTAACLFADGHLTLPVVLAVALDLINAAAYTPVRLANSLGDISRRGHLAQPGAIAVREYLRARGLLPPPRRERVRPTLRQRLVGWLRGSAAPVSAAVAPIDYRSLVAAWRGGR